MENQFYAGYKEHLKWHREKNDPFGWYGWTVLTGNRVDLFVDGTFGISYEAFDNRVSPREDIAHFRETTAPYADAVYRKVFKLERDLSTAFRLESWNPSHNMGAISYTVRAGKEAAFERIITKVKNTLQNIDQATEFSVYRQLTGGSLPSYLILVHQNGFSHFDSNISISDLDHFIRQNFIDEEADELLNELSESVIEIYGEIWLYRSDLSYFPETR